MVVASSADSVINKVRNDASDANLDWIEIYNGGPAQNIKNWKLTVVTMKAMALVKVWILSSLVGLTNRFGAMSIY